MAEVADMLNSDEGKELYSKMMKEVETVISDPEMMRKVLPPCAPRPSSRACLVSVLG